MSQTNNDAITNPEPGFFKTVATDDGVQRAAAGVVVALIVAGAKELIFGTAK